MMNILCGATVLDFIICLQLSKLLWRAALTFGQDAILLILPTSRDFKKVVRKSIGLGFQESQFIQQ